MDVYTSDSSDTDSREQKTLDFSRLNLTEIRLDEDDLCSAAKTPVKSKRDVETLLLNHNSLRTLPAAAFKEFHNLKILDLSSNNLTELPDALSVLPLVTLIAKNNRLTNKSLPKTFLSKNNTSNLKELNLSGNYLTHFPEQVLELRNLRYFYIGGNKITTIAKDIWKMQSLQVLSMGGNLITEVPESVGALSQLQALVLCDNLIENLPMSIAGLRNLKSLLLHKNQLKHLPKGIVALKNLTELSLRDNPLVVRFVQDISLSPPTLMELAARIVKSNSIPYGPGDLPRTTIEYLSCANCCVNPNCKGVFFDNRVEHIKFVDFCGKYRVPLLQYLCSSKCIEPEKKQRPTTTSNYGNNDMMRKVLLG